MATVDELKGKVVSVSDFVHVVNGKIICFKPGTYDLENVHDLKRLISFSEKLYVSSWYPRRFGRETVCCVTKYPDADEFSADTNHFIDEFPEDVRSDLREAMKYVEA